MSASTPNLFSCRLIAVVIAGREVLMVRKRHTGLWDLPSGDLRVGEHPEAGLRRIAESDSSTVVAITGICNCSTSRLSLVFPSTPFIRPINCRVATHAPPVVTSTLTAPWLGVKVSLPW